MNTRTIVASLLSVLVLGWAGLSMAGVDPSPFHQLINKLDSVENVLDAKDDHLREILSAPPDPYKTNALVNKLNSMADKLWNQHGRVVDVIDAYLSIPIDPCHEEVFMAALGEVGIKASSIVERAGQPPDPCIPEVEEALGNVQAAAEAILLAVGG